MRVKVTWGHPASACKRGPFNTMGVRGEHICYDEEEARDLALSLAYVMSEGRGPSNFDDYAMLLGHGKPRETWWSHDRSSWVEVTYLGES